MDPMTIMGLMQAGSGIANMLFGENPSDAAMPYLDQIKPELQKYLGPYIEAGNRQLPGLERHFGNLMESPGNRLNEIGMGFQKSPGYDFALKQALEAANHAAAAGGMAGSPQHQYQSMDIASQFANRDYNQWIQNALGLYGTGLGGAGNIYGIGAQTATGLGEDLANVLGNQAKLAYEGSNNRNQQMGGGFGSIFGGLGSLFGGKLDLGW